MREAGLTTTPQPMMLRRPGWRIPEGIVWSTNFSRPTTTVWPALLPPWYRTTTSTSGAMQSTTLPLPSSPHCIPTTTMLGIEVPLGDLQHGRDGHRRFRAFGEFENADLPGRGAGVAD